jgi:putative transposase
MVDHVHILISVSPKYSVSQVMRFIKGKSAISITRTSMGRKKNFTGMRLRDRGFNASTVGYDAIAVRESIKRKISA